MPDRLTGAQVAARFRVSRSTVYRWADAGLIPPAWNWCESTIAPLVGVVTKRQRGPKRDRYSRRYVTGRRRFEEVGK